MACIVTSATAGTLESSDVFVELRPAQGIEIELDSVVKKQFGDSICASVKEVLEEQHITDAHVHLIDRGALDCVIRARVETAIQRGRGKEV